MFKNLLVTGIKLTRRNFFWGPRNPFETLERELRRFEDEFRRWNRDMLNAWEHQSSNSALPSRTNDKSMSLFNPSTNKSLESEHTFVDKDGNKKIKMSFDMTHFKPEDIKIKLDGSTLAISAKSHDRTEKGSIYREFHREFTLPENIEADQVKSKLEDNGVLSLEAPFKKATEDVKKLSNEIPIEKN